MDEREFVSKWRTDVMGGVYERERGMEGLKEKGIESGKEG